uniref:RecT protein n=1 Tax=Siphoviridae sp. ct2hZ16 TaxID=2826276 RepID=A0A8S5QV84_9CAUD|nr:MAG TPA: RecT protein [Siphoviridae sp. ct2hZ16]
MTTSNQMVQQKMPFSVAVNTPSMQKLIANALHDPARCARFTASIVSAVSVNQALQNCDRNTVISGALLGESLNLSPSPQLGQYYLVPFNNKKKGIQDAQFVLGYKGYVQLALRSGQYKSINVDIVKQGEYKGRDPMTGDPRFQFIEDDDEWERLPVIGYMASFEYLNGFRKVLYWSKEKMMNHADRYSAAFSRKAYENLIAGNIPQGEMWKYSSFWYKDFDSMAKKTMLRQLISKWGIMSVDMQVAYESDGRVIDETESGQLVLQVEEESSQQLEEPQAAAQIPAQPAEPKQIDLSSL